jgi:hypothetical protein
MELKGIIKIEEYSKSITCCKSVTDIMIGGESLYDSLESWFGPDAEEFRNGKGQEKSLSVRYVILDEAPTEEKSFDDLSAEVVMKTIYTEYEGGCYSEWTCGYGGFNYVAGSGHSIFEELSDIGREIYSFCDMITYFIIALIVFALLSLLLAFGYANNLMYKHEKWWYLTFQNIFIAALFHISVPLIIFLTIRNIKKHY